MPRPRTLAALLLVAFALLAPLPSRAAPGPARNLSWLSDARSGVDSYILSPDGRYIAYTVSSDIIDPSNLTNKYDIYLVATTGGPPRRLTTVQRGPEAFTDSKFSPDSRYFVYALYEWPEEGSGLYSVSVAGGEPVRLDAPNRVSRRFEITADSSKVVLDQLTVVPITGGPRQELYNGSVERFVLTGDGKYAVFTAIEDGVPRLLSVSVGGGAVVRLDAGPRVLERALVASDSRRVFYKTLSGPLYGVDVDGKRRVQLDTQAGQLSNWSLLPTSQGYTVFYPKGHPEQGGVDLAAVADTGGKSRLLKVAEREQDLLVLSVTPGGRHVLYQSRRSGFDPARFYSVPAGGGQRVRLPGEGEIVYLQGIYPYLVPTITPDGNRFIYITNDAVSGRRTLYSTLVSSGKGTVLASLHLPGNTSDIRYVLSPDGALVAYIVPSGPNGFYEIFVVPVAGGAPTRVAGPFQYANWDSSILSFTPDSRSLLYTAGQDRPTIVDLYIVPVR